MNPCPYCGTLMSNPRRKQCGEPACKRAFNVERTQQWQATHPDYATYRKRYRRPNKPQTQPCAWCGRTWTTKRFGAQACSLLCRDALAASGRGTEWCKWCGAQRGVTSKYCSTKCGRKAVKARRRAMERNAYVADVNPVEIYVRDEWKCQLCGLALEREAAVPHPRAPTIDHIVPLARDGTHEPSNVQAACFLCNARKGAKLDYTV